MIEKCSLCPIAEGPCYAHSGICEAVADPAIRERFRAHHTAYLAEHGPAIAAARAAALTAEHPPPPGGVPLGGCCG